MLIDNSLLLFAGSQIGVADEQGDLVVFVQVGPQLLGEGIDVGGDAHTLRLALEGGDHGIATPVCGPVRNDSFLLMLIDNSLLERTGFDIGEADEQGDLIVLVQILPQHFGEAVDGAVDGDPLRLTLEGGDHGVAVADIGVQEMTQTGFCGVLPEETGTGIALRISRFQDGHLVAAVTGGDAGDPGGIGRAHV